jgi:nitroreductase
VRFAEVVRRRRMVRDYDPDRPVPAEVTDRLLAHALRAPVAGPADGRAVLVLAAAADRELFWSATTPPGRPPSAWLTGMRRAPLIVVPIAERPAGGSAPYADIDAGFAAMLILLAAVDEGLGACFFGIPAGRVAAFRDALGVPPDRAPIGAITVGYRAPDRRSPSLSRGRRPEAQVVHWRRWRPGTAQGVPGS